MKLTKEEIENMRYHVEAARDGEKYIQSPPTLRGQSLLQMIIDLLDTIGGRDREIVFLRDSLKDSERELLERKIKKSVEEVRPYNCKCEMCSVHTAIRDYGGKP